MSKTKFDYRNLIAFLVVLGGFIFVIAYIYLHPDKDSLNSILPVIATWVGTVIAFYFGRENFEAASKSLQEVINTLTPEQKMASIKIKDVMIPIDKLEYEVFTNDTPQIKVLDLLSYKVFEQYQRLAFFDTSRVFKYMIHKSTFTGFLVTNYQNSNKDLADITFDKLLEDSDIKKKLEKSVSFVLINSNLLEAKKAIDTIPECLDVFVTQTGISTEPVLGLITNNKVLEYMRI